MHKLFPSNLYNLIFSSAAAFWSVGSLPGRNTMRRLPLRSPPRMRGKGCCHHLVVLVHGITPAYAGKRNCRFTQWRRGFGSPPRMRGKADPNDSKVSAPRITPAYAGKSLTIPKLYTRNRDHPRVCGEKEVRHQSRASGIGSPPRMRGKVCCVHSPAPVCGITPAYAGKSIILWFKGFDN